MSAETRETSYIAIDFGNNNITVAIGSAGKTPHWIEKTAIDFAAPEDGPPGAIEFDTAATLELIFNTTRAAIQKSGVETTAIAGIGVTSQSRGLVFLDFDGSPIYAGPSADIRASKTPLSTDSSSPVDIWEFTGQAPESSTAWARLRWFEQHKPEIYRQTRTVCSIADWIAYELTGELLMEQSLGVDSGLSLLATGDPATGIGNSLGLSDIQLPSTSAAGTTIGALQKSHAELIGVPAKTPVVTCGPSTHAGLIGLGTQVENSVGIHSGWNTSCMRVVERPVFDDTRALTTSRHVIENRWLLSGNAGDTGATYQWILSLLYGSLNNIEVMNSIDEALENTEPGEASLSTYLGPSLIHTDDATQRTGGILFPIPITQSPPDRFDISRAALDSFAYAIRFNVERLQSFRGPALSVSVGGGMMKTSTFRQILADVLGCEIGVETSGEATSLGTIDQTAAAIGKGPTISEYCAVRSNNLQRYEPDPSRAAVYDSLYSEWRHNERMLENLELQPCPG